MRNRAVIHFDDTYQCIGSLLRRDEELADFGPETFRGQQYALLLYWRRASLPYLSVKLKINGKAAPTGVGAFQSIAADSDLALPKEWQKTRLDADEIIALKLSASDKLTISVRLDTDHPQFWQAAKATLEEQRDKPEERRGMALSLSGYFLADSDQKEAALIMLVIKPAKAVEPFQGYVGLDIGNFNSSVASLERRHREPSEIRMLREYRSEDFRAELATEAPAILSPVCLTAVPKGRVDDSPDSVHWEIGIQAQEHSARIPEGMERAAKRLLASPEYQRTKRYRAFDRLTGGTPSLIDVDISQYVPGELLACRLLQKFREAARRRPSKIAVSYPTTFTERELAQLREIAHRAWLRMNLNPQSPERLAILRQAYNPTQMAEDEGVCLMLDEASAAAFFFLYNRIITAPGGLARFRYLYPRGMNLLLYDCGGGTTDIALVRASVRPERPRNLILSVRGRVGHRVFGGDFITEQVFKLLKAKAAERLALDAFHVPNVQQLSAVELEKLFRKHGDVIERFVPTRFNREYHDSAARRCEDRSWKLWALAEHVKLQLFKIDPPRDLPKQPVAANPRAVPPQHAAKDRRLTIENANWEGILAADIKPDQRTALQISIGRSEVDCLIRPMLRDTIDLCNRLIKEKLIDKKYTGRAEDHEEPEEVHWVVAAGGASRTPLVRDLLKQELDVPFLNITENESEESGFCCPRFTLNEENLKSSVAKGLVLAMAAKDVRLGIDLEFDSELSRRLPFEVFFRDANGKDKILFRENAHFDSMRDARSLMPDIATQADELPDGTTPGQYVILYRRFPGESESRPYLLFSFDEGIEGDLTVRYDPDEAPAGHSESPFVMLNQIGEQGRCKDLTDKESYLHPVQRGDL